MGTSLSFEQHLAALTDAGTLLGERAASAGPSVPVPSCPGWTGADLLAHISLIHRWAAGHLLGRDEDELLREEALLRLPDPAGYYAEGHQLLVETLRTVPEDVDAMVFLHDTPRPREFWARRQAHETTMHAVDALAAELGRLPLADEVTLSGALAEDGIDELLCGFLPRRRSRWPDPFTCAIRPDDSERRWSLVIGPESITANGRDCEDPDVTLIGTAAELYLGLWNRGDQVRQDGSIDLLGRWRELQRVRWE